MKNGLLLSLFISLSLFSCRSGEVKKDVPIHSAETSKKKTKEPETIDVKNCICVQLWMPVCGENGKTYSNSCFAQCARVKYIPGSCAKQIGD